MARGDRVPILAGRRLATVRARLNSVGNFDLVVDTGAVPMVISAASAARLGLDRVQPQRVVPLVGVGQSAPAPVVRLDTIRVGASVVRGLDAAVFDLPANVGVDGVLGLSFLDRFRVTFEFDTRTLVLRAPPARPPR
jgi:clan AA aspartic protease (TIGR02281 family)